MIMTFICGFQLIISSQFQIDYNLYSNSLIIFHLPTCTILFFINWINNFNHISFDLMVRFIDPILKANLYTWYKTYLTYAP